MKYLHALNIINGVGSQKMRLLLDFFGSAEKAWRASRAELAQCGLGEKLVDKIVFERDRINPDTEMEKLRKENVRLISFLDAAYPRLLKEIANPPAVLYVKSHQEIDFNSTPLVAIVGSRKVTQYGTLAARSLARDLAQAGVTVVSGLALGIDALAHRGALEGGGQTIAIMGSSLEDDLIGPRTNFELSQEIMEHGALVSEYPLGTPANVGTFPTRNRLMAGMTLGTVVIEAAPDSGSLITASLALEFSREVFAVPGSIFSPQSIGTNTLIKSGAKIVTCVKDILEELRIEEIQKTAVVKKLIPQSAEEEVIAKILSHEPVHIDNIIKLSKLGTSAASSTLSIMEMKGLVKNIGGQNYILY